MKKIFLVISLLLIANFANAQETSKASCDCVNENLKLPDSVKYLKAQEDAREIKPSEKRPLKIISEKERIEVLRFAKPANDGTCASTNEDLARYQEGKIFIFLLTEFDEVYRKKMEKDEFKNVGNEKRLRMLLGLPPNDNSKCIVKILIDGSKVIRPSIIPKITEPCSFFSSKWGDESVFTSLGYTCDWYYGDGCEYGFTEFNIPPPIVSTTETDKPKIEEKYLEVESSCTIDEYISNGKCLKKYPNK